VDKTKIEWTDATWNIINGCTVVSPGCAHCYAMRLAATRMKDHPSREGLAVMHKGEPQWTGEITFYKPAALQPFQWTRPRMIFVCAHGDLFHKDVPDQWIDYVFMAALLNPRHTFQILTKRPERMCEYMRMVNDEAEEQTATRFAVAMLHAGLQDSDISAIDIHWPPRNVWLGTSVEDQERADERVPHLLAAPAAVRWLSCEPLLGPVDLTKVDAMLFRGAELVNALTGTAMDFLGEPVGRVPKLDWVVVGGESGPRSRPMHPAWARQLRDQSKDARVPFLFKQWGDWATWEPRYPADVIYLDADGSSETDPGVSREPMVRVGKREAGRTLDGFTYDGFPARQEVA
jgi:protein gp37